MKTSVRLLSITLASLLILGLSVSVTGLGQAADDQESDHIEISTQESAHPILSPEPDPDPVPDPEPTPRLVSLTDVRTFTFSDVESGTPTADCISYTAYNGILLGAGNDRFYPDGLANRGMVVTVLYRMSGETFEPTDSFSDVKRDDWFADAVAWAVKAGIATGYDDGTFRGSLAVTRAHLAAFLYRFAAYNDGRDYSAVLANYTDSASVPDYARTPMAWALENDLFAGMVFDTIYPDLPVTRAQLAQALTALIAYGGDHALAEAITDSLRVTSVSFSSEAHDRIQAAVDATAKKYGAMGMQVAVIHNGEVIDSFATGWATKGTDPMTVDHKIRVASLTKVDVAMAAMVLWDQGIIDPDEPIGKYWGTTMRNPYYKDTPVSIRSILSHTSSIRLFGDDVSLRNAAVKSKLTSSSGYSQVKPGSISAYGYNNYAFGVLGMTLELAAGQKLSQVMEPIFSLMDLDVAYYSGDIAATDLHTTIYRGTSANRSVATARNNVSPSTPGASGASFAGGFTASAKDQAQLVTLLINDGKFQGVPLLSEEAVEFMETPMGYISDGSYYQCYPLRYQNGLYGRDTLYYHTGSAYGVYNLLSYDPDTGDGVVVLTSGASAAKDSRGIYAVCGSISNTIYNFLAGGEIDPASKDDSKYILVEYVNGDYVMVEAVPALTEGYELVEAAEPVGTELVVVTENGEEHVITTSPAEPEG